MNKLRLYNSDYRNMAELPDESVQCVVTSPPYWGLRKYAGLPDTIWGNVDHCEHEWVDVVTREDNLQGGPNSEKQNTVRGSHATDYHKRERVTNSCSLCGAWRGQFGLEPTVDMYVQHTVEILREVRRVLRKDGVCFWNVGDSYWGGGGGNYGGGKDLAKKNAEIHLTNVKNRYCPDGLKPKDLCLIPFRVALAAQGDGWWVRSVIIWSKPNPMPESVTDRPTESHEYILMLTKSARYYWDQEAVREKQTESSVERAKYGWHGRTDDGSNGARTGSSFRHMAEGDGLIETIPADGNRNLRSVWDFPTQPYPKAHFATFPEALPERCIKAATPEVGSCARCGSPWVREVERDNPSKWAADDDSRDWANTHQKTSNPQSAQSLHRNGEGVYSSAKTLGWRPSCKCGTDEKCPAVVLDPFAGSGTTLWVARRMGREAVGYELSPDYCKLIEDRNRQGVL